MEKNTNLQDSFLNQIIKDNVPVSVYLLNGIKLQGQVKSFDQYVIVLSGNTPQLIYKHSISTIVPSQTINLEVSDSN
ncbi:RNA chaperone Hfq [Methylophilaceae bacterium]|jgi:host factor-I protein|nr:RNA chaperone Hfq [Nitrosomonadales bacterium]MDB4040422.1 RNA chaperone Hfq [Methylophilaceae bacterium]|tara:strand:+ start:334 stop:564 length:231 start_codon:yes stop_codon:yes gene_type:complete